MKVMSTRGTMAASCLSFFALGLATAALGPALPDLSANTASSLAAIGAVFSAIFLGSSVAQVVAGPTNDRLGQRPVLLVGVGLFAAGLLGLTLSHTLPLLLASAVIAGFGHGSIDVSMNVLVAELFAARSASALNLLNVFFGIGAVVGPAVAGLTLRALGTALPALWIGIALMLLLVPLLPRLSLPPRSSQHSEHTANAPSVLRSPLLWALGAILLLYVGGEMGIGGWAATYLERTTTIGLAESALVTAGFWLALTGGRIAATWLGTRVTSDTLLLLSLAGSAAGSLLLAFSTGNAVLTIVAVLITGLCYGPIFPTVVAIVTATFRRTPGTATSVAVALGSVGGMLLPWLQGILLDRRGPVASILLVAAGALGMLALNALRGMLTSRQLSVVSRKAQLTTDD